MPAFKDPALYGNPYGSGPQHYGATQGKEGTSNVNDISEDNVWDAASGQTKARAGSPGLDTSRSDQERAASFAQGARQTQLADMLARQAQGQGPTVAGQQMRAGLEDSISMQRGLAASARGGNVGLAQASLASGVAQAQAASNRDAAMLRAQEQLSAQNLLSQHLQQQRMADLTSRGYSIEEARAALDAEMAAQGMNTQIAMQNASNRQKTAGGLLSAGGALLGLSDMRAKQDVQPMSFGAQLHQSFAPSQYNGYGAPQGYQASQGEDPLKRLQDQRMAQQTGAQAQAGGEGGGGGGLDIGGALGSLGGGMMSDSKSKSRIAKLEAENAALKDSPTVVYQDGQYVVQDEPQLRPKPVTLAQAWATQDHAKVRDHAEDYEPEDAKQADWLASQWYATRAEEARRDAAAWEADRRQQDVGAPNMGLVEMRQAQSELDARRRVAEHPGSATQPWQPRPLAQPRGQTAAAMLSDMGAKQDYSMMSDKRAKEQARQEGRMEAILNPELYGKMKGLGPMRDGNSAGRMPDLGEYADKPMTASESRKAMAPMEPYQYRYKPEFAAAYGYDTEPRAGIMAQDAQRSPVMRDMVVKQPNGLLGIDRDKALSLSLAQNAGMDKRIRELEAETDAYEKSKAKKSELDKIGEDAIRRMNSRQFPGAR